MTMLCIVNMKELQKNFKKKLSLAHLGYIPVASEKWETSFSLSCCCGWLVGGFGVVAGLWALTGSLLILKTKKIFVSMDYF